MAGPTRGEEIGQEEQRATARMKGNRGLERRGRGERGARTGDGQTQATQKTAAESGRGRGTTQKITAKESENKNETLRAKRSRRRRGATNLQRRRPAPSQRKQRVEQSGLK